MNKNNNINVVNVEPIKNNTSMVICQQLLYWLFVKIVCKKGQKDIFILKLVEWLGTQVIRLGTHFFRHQTE